MACNTKYQPHGQERDGGGSANSSDVLVATQRQAPERIVEQSVNVVVPPIMEGISAVEQITPHEHVQERIVEQSVYVAHRMVDFLHSELTGQVIGQMVIVTSRQIRRIFSCGTTQRYQPSRRLGILLRFRRYSSLTRTLWTSLLWCSDRCLLSQEIPRVHDIERIVDLTIVLSRQVRTIRAVQKTDVQDG